MTTPKPSALPPWLDSVPLSLQQIPRWLVWKHYFNEKRQRWTKLPMDPKASRKRASSTDPATWASFDEAALAYAGGDYDGVGITFNGDGLVGLDFDKCLDPETGELSDVVNEALTRIQGIWEVSPSGRGLHCFTRAEIPKAFKDDRKGLELYKAGRYFTVTGRIFQHREQLPNAQQDLSWFITKHFADQPPTLKPPVIVDGVVPYDTKNFFRRVNDAAMGAFDAWVPSLFPAAKPLRQGYRVASADLGRDLEEDISIQPEGIVDFGVADMGDTRQGKRTAIDLVMEQSQLNAREAAFWLCEQLELAPLDLGWLHNTVPNLDFRLDKYGAIKAEIGNVYRALQSPDYCGRQIAYDLFRDEILIAPAGTEEWVPFTDADYVRLRLDFGERGFKPVGRDLVKDAVLLCARQNQFDSATRWLESLQHDGQSRIERFLIDYFGCEDTPYTRAVSLYWWTAMAGRVMEPGCKADMVPILVGLQGAVKTTAISALVPSPDHFAEVRFDEKDEDLARKMRGCLIGEIAELRGLNSRDIEGIKAFVTRTHEKWVPKYLEFATTYPRRLILVGSTNENEFLADLTGNRRWLPVRVDRADAAALQRDRLQLWAEARELHGLLGVCWQDAERLATVEHDEFAVGDAWQDAIGAWLDTPEKSFEEGAELVPPRMRPVTVPEILHSVLGFSLKDATKSHEMRIAKILQAFGFVRKKLRIGGKQHKAHVSEQWLKANGY